MSDTVQPANDKTKPKSWEEHFKDITDAIESGNASRFVGLLSATANEMVEGLRSRTRHLMRKLQDACDPAFLANALRLLTRELRDREFRLRVTTYLCEVKRLIFAASQQFTLSSV